MSYVRLLSEIEESDSPQVGGKAANLAKLIHAGLPVPAGLAVGLDAFGNDGKLKDDAKKIIDHYVKSDKLYAVRSSALSEDAAGASWAGQFETFLDTKLEDVIVKVEECHGSTKARAKAYASDKTVSNSFDIAVVVQEMIKPEYAGVLFTKDPVTGADKLVTEYVEGLGEELVSGRADPKQIIWSPGEKPEVPFDITELTNLAQTAEKAFGSPQDIEWVWAKNKIWLVQARPITATQTNREGYYLGEPDDLFYWGPSRAEPMYMSDFMVAMERFFIEMYINPDLPTPPKTIALFYEHKNVWLINAKSFAEFTEKTFEAYEKLNLIEDDIAKWHTAIGNLEQHSNEGTPEKLIEAWLYTEFAEFSLYGAEEALVKKLKRFDSQTRQQIWSAFTTPDNKTFMARIDSELAISKNTIYMAKKYPWIQNGYDGLSSKALQYFENRLKIVGNEVYDIKKNDTKRTVLTKKLKLTVDELNALNLARKIAEFMDERKSWMMKSRPLLTRSISEIEYGWFFNKGKSRKISKEDTRGLWQRYVDFKTSTNAVIGIVASNGGKHFINGEVAVVTSPTDSVEDGKIIVVPSTSPSYIPLMRKAKALITDHGGMMSHAAIVAREFNLPCIVSTKLATKLLKTGDKVVLDLVRGEVNK